MAGSRCLRKALRALTTTLGAWKEGSLVRDRAAFTSSRPTRDSANRTRAARSLSVISPSIGIPSPRSAAALRRSGPPRRGGSGCSSSQSPVAHRTSPTGDTERMASRPGSGDELGPDVPPDRLDVNGPGTGAVTAPPPGGPAGLPDGSGRRAGPARSSPSSSTSARTGWWPAGTRGGTASRPRRGRAPPTTPGGHHSARGWWIAILFAVGSALFALGAVPGYAGVVGAKTDAITFFVGSVFFTSAGFLQYRESVDAGADGRPHGWGRVFVYRPRQIDWWASGIQLIGTLYFNVSTGTAVGTDLTAQAAHQHVWRPDVVGSVCFLVASSLAWFEVCHAWVAWSPTSLSWWITALNLVGSVAFGVSAVAAFIVPATGQLWNAELSNLGTFVGALCFLAGAFLLLPERTAEMEASTPPPTSARPTAGPAAAA